jgi:hypothetical protein
MQHDEKLGTMKLIMLYHQGGPNGFNILILILMPRSGVQGFPYSCPKLWARKL